MIRPFGAVRKKRKSANSSSCESVLDAIGGTPLVRLRRYLTETDIRLFVKLESFNPGGSAKDRPARRMIEQALATGEIDEYTTVIESSSGNMGIGLAQVCRYYGLRLIVVVDPHAQAQNVGIMRSLGAKIDRVTKPLDGSFLSARHARVSSLLERTPGGFWPNQYANENNPLSHQLGTIREIDEALNGVIDYLFVATSSTGTVRGCREYLRAKARRTRVVAVDAEGSVLFGGQLGPRKIPGIGAGRTPKLAVGQQYDHVRRVTDIDCVVGCRRMADREAILVGGSAGGVMEAIRSLSSQLRGKTCAAILHDSGTRYLETVFSDDWVERELGVAPEQLKQLITETDIAPEAAGV